VSNVIANLGGNTVTVPAYVLSSALGSGSSLTLSQSIPGTAAQTQINTVSSAANLTPVSTLAFSLSTSSGTAVSSLSGSAAVVLKLTSAQISQLSNATASQLYYYDPSTGTLTDMNATFDLSAGTATFTATHFGTFLIACANSQYSLTADAHYTTTSTGKTFSVNVLHSAATASLSNPKLMVVTTLADGSQTFSFYSVSGASQTVTVSAKAVKSTVYLINGDFDGANIPTTYALAVSVTES
jgi:hypothetical protein